MSRFAPNTTFLFPAPQFLHLKLMIPPKTHPGQCHYWRIYAGNLATERTSPLKPAIQNPVAPGCYRKPDF